jgi:hypothetical protein
VKISFDKSWAIFFWLHVDALSKRSLLNITLDNQQTPLEKLENLDFEDQAYCGHGIAKGKVRDPARKALP